MVQVASVYPNASGVEISLNIAKAGTGIHANVPPGPVIDRRGCRRRSLHGHISRKSKPARGKRECSPPNNGNDPVAHWNPPPATVIATGAVLPATKTTIPQICGLCCSGCTVRRWGLKAWAIPRNNDHYGNRDKLVR